MWMQSNLYTHICTCIYICMYVRTYIRAYIHTYSMGQYKVSVPCSCNNVYCSVFVPFPFLLHSLFSFTCLACAPGSFQRVHQAAHFVLVQPEKEPLDYFASSPMGYCRESAKDTEVFARL